MEDGFLILVFIAVAVLQGIGQKRRQDAKKRQQGQMGAPPRAPAGPRPTPEAQTGASTGAKARSSEGLIPSDVWEEILGLARGTTEAPGGKTLPPEPREAQRAQPGRLEPSPRSPPGGVRGTTPDELQPGPRRSELSERDRKPRPRSPDPSRRSPIEARPGEREAVPAASAVPVAVAAQPVEKAPDSEGEGRGRDAQAAGNSLFGDGSVEELRKAIILKEVLGPPLSLRDEGR